VVSSNRINIVESNKLFPPGKMRNIGANHAQGDSLFFIDDDCIPPPEWIEFTSRIFVENSNVGAVGCRVIGVKDTFWDRCADYALFTGYQSKKAFKGPLGSAAIAVRKEAFESVHGFEENLLASEDWDLSLKLISKGWHCFFNPDTFVRHDHRRDRLCKIIRMGYLSGNRSGLVVQKMYKDKISIPASILVRFKNPWLYPFISIPYAISLALFQITSLLKSEKKVIIYSPFMIICRIAYQSGVWIRLIKK